MSSVLYDTAASINGYLADADESLAWLFEIPGGTESDSELLPQNISVMVEGSHTYEWVLRELNLIAEPERWAEFSADRPVFVFTSRELPVPDGADVRFVRGTVAQALRAIRAAAGDGDIWVVGGGDLAGQFFDAGALDEIALSYAPAALAGGTPLLPRDIRSGRLELIEAKAVGPFARVRYRVKSSV